MEWGRAGLGDQVWGEKRKKIWNLMAAEGWGKIQTSGSYGIQVDSSSDAKKYLLLRPGVSQQYATKRVDLFDSWSQICVHLRKSRWHNLPPKSTRERPPPRSRRAKAPVKRPKAAPKIKDPYGTTSIQVQSSLYRGVSWSNSMRKWHAYVTRPSGTNGSAGYHMTQEDAARARYVCAARMFFYKILLTLCFQCQR